MVANVTSVLYEIKYFRKNSRLLEKQFPVYRTRPRNNKKSLCANKENAGYE